MNKISKQEERERICLEEHERLAKLFKENRFSYEQERKRLIEENIGMKPEENIRKNLTSFQQRIDKILSGAGSQHNRFVMIQTLFWNQIVNVWIPALDSCKQGLNKTDLSTEQVTVPLLYLVDKQVSENEYRSTLVK